MKAKPCLGICLASMLAAVCCPTGGARAQVEGDPVVIPPVKIPEGEREAGNERAEGRAQIRIMPGDLPDDLTDEQRAELIRRLIEARERQQDMRGLRIRVEGEAIYQPAGDASAAMGPLGRLEKRLIDRDLSAQERAELIRDGRGIFERAPRAALGVQFRTPAAEGEVTIERALDGFPVAEYLRAGDVIARVDGRPLAGTDHLRAEILSRLPGETLPMTVRRSIPGLEGEAANTRELELEVPLGGYEKLEQAGPEERLLHAAWRARVERLLERTGVNNGAEIGAGLTGVDWLRNEGLWWAGEGEDAAGERRAGDGPAGDGRGVFGRVSPERIISIGGRPEDAAQRIAFRRGDQRSMLQEARVRGARGRTPGATAEARTSLDRLRDAMDSYRLLSLEIASYRTALEQVRTGRVGNDRVAERMETLRSTIDRLRDSLEQVEGEIASIQEELDLEDRAGTGSETEANAEAASGGGDSGGERAQDESEDESDDEANADSTDG